MVTKFQKKMREQRRIQRESDIAAWKETLVRMGFRTYQLYLASELWMTIRRRVFARDGSRCVACGRDASHAHHRKYADEVMTGENIGPIVSLCPRCHRKVEFRCDGGKRTLYAAEIVLKTILRHARNRKKSK